MSSLEDLSLDFASLRRAYAEGLTPVALVGEVYRRLHAREGDFVWTHTVPIEQAIRQAAHIERLAADGHALPLYGVPYGVKDNIDVAGLPTSAGCASFSYIAERTAAVVERLSAAGAILIGKQNMDQFATGLVGIRSPGGYCRNPFDSDYIPGGSSSGSAVAVSTGQVAFSIGSDTGGSGRVPAAFNNIIGFKPTPGLVSSYGFLYCNRSFDVPPVFALTVSDALAVFDAVKGHDPRDIYSVAQAPRPANAATRFRFGIPDAAHLAFFGDGAAEKQFRHAVDLLRELGGEPVELDFGPFEEAGRLLFSSPFIAERYVTYGEHIGSGSPDVHPVVRQAIMAAAQYDAASAFDGLYRLEELKRLAWRQLERVAFLLTPTAGTIYRCIEVEAAPVQRNTDLGYYTYHANPLRLSAVSVPAGLRSDGLPFGACLTGKPFDDLTIAAYADRLHRAASSRLGATRHPLTN